MSRVLYTSPTGGDTSSAQLAWYTHYSIFIIISLFQPLDSKPNMINLIKLSTSEGEIKIVEETAPRYREIGTILLNDRSGAKVDAMVGGIPKEAVHKIYSHWIKEDVDHSWRKLAQCLRDCDLNVLANKIEKHFRLSPPQQSHEGVLYMYILVDSD